MRTAVTASWILGILAAGCSGGETTTIDASSSADAEAAVSLKSLRMGRRRTRAGALAAGVVVVSLWACNHVPDPCITSYGEPAPVTVQLHVIGEDGAPIARATATIGDTVVTGDAQGLIALPQFDQPMMILVAAPDHLSEPVPAGTVATSPIEVRLWSAGGRRFVMHSAGDVMFGRRYEQPTSGPPLIPRDDAAAGAEAVVESVRAAFSSADFRTINLETVVSDRDAAAAYPGKRFILRSRPETLAALARLGVDVASQANNHARDYLDVGITDTVASLVAHGLPIVGVSPDGRTAAPFTTTVHGTRIAEVAYTTINGSTVNDAYPHDSDPAPSDPGASTWQYNARTWGFSGTSAMIALLARRIGGAWLAFQKVEASAGNDLGPLWQSLAGIYPEMQDWVTRRGHGGAEPWSSDAKAQISALKASNDVVIVQLHAGFQFVDASSESVRQITREAIDAGADLVICHHPHVLQGIEFYKGHLIAYSLGNFIFDQDFLSTFASVFLRTVWDGNQLLEARIVPVELVDYRPVPVTDAAARQTLFRVWERSVIGAATARDKAGAVHAFPISLDADTAPASILVEHDTGRLVAPPPVPTPIILDIPPGAVAPIGFDGLVEARLGRPVSDSDIEIGRDLLGWGRFEDETADSAAAGDTHWSLDSCQEAVVRGAAASGTGFLRLQRTLAGAVLTRPVARIPLPRHRLWAAGTLASLPMDPAPSYSLHAKVRITGPGGATARIDVFHFDDTNPTEDPTSDSLGRIDRAIDVPHDGAWHDIDVPIAIADLDQPSSEANMVLVYFSISRPPNNVLTTFDLDDVSFIEWRTAGGMPAGDGTYQFVRNTGAGAVTLQFDGLGATR